MIDRMLTPKEVAEILCVNYETALAFIKRSGIDYLRVGHQYRVSEEKFKAFLARKGRIIVELE